MGQTGWKSHPLKPESISVKSYLMKKKRDKKSISDNLTTPQISYDRVSPKKKEKKNSPFAKNAKEEKGIIELSHL